MLIYHYYSIVNFRTCIFQAKLEMVIGHKYLDPKAKSYSLSSMALKILCRCRINRVENGFYS